MLRHQPDRKVSNTMTTTPKHTPSNTQKARTAALLASTLTAACGGLAKEVSGVGVATGAKKDVELIKAAAQKSALESLSAQLSADAVTFAYQAVPGSAVLSTKLEGATATATPEFTEKDGWTVATAKSVRSDAALQAMKGLKFVEVSGEANRKGADLARLLGTAESRALRAAVALAEPEQAKDGRIAGSFTIGARTITWTDAGVRVDLKVAVSVKEKGALPPEQKAGVLKKAVLEAELLDDTARALELRKQVVELAPGDGSAQEAYARALLLAGNNALAADAFAKAATLLPSRADELTTFQIEALRPVDAAKADALLKQQNDAKAAKAAALAAAKATYDAAKATADAARDAAAARLAELQAATSKPGTKLEIARAQVAALTARIEQAKADGAVADAAGGTAAFEKDPVAAAQKAKGAKAAAEASAADAAKALEAAQAQVALEEKVEKIHKRGKPRK
jgi:hypothetical protein